MHNQTCLTGSHLALWLCSTRSTAAIDCAISQRPVPFYVAVRVGHRGPVHCNCMFFPPKAGIKHENNKKLLCPIRQPAAAR
jgi:hypothetical protein